MVGNRWTRWALGIIAASSLCSCAAMNSKGPFAVAVDSSPQGAIIRYRGNDVGRTPCTIYMVNKSTELLLRLDGYHEQKVEVNRVSNSDYVILGFLLWGPFELLFDAAADAWSRISTEPFRVPLTPVDRPAPQSWSPPKPAHYKANIDPPWHQR